MNTVVGSLARTLRWSAMGPITRQMSVSDSHDARRRAIIASHPEVRLLVGPCAQTALWVAPAVLFQFAVAAAVAQTPWWVAPIAAYLVGAFATHALNVVIHESAHDLVFRRPWQNKLCAIAANLPAGLPSAMAFRHYHLLHHRYLGERRRDADVAPAWEARLIGRGRFGKLVWLLVQPFTYAVTHPLQVGDKMRIDGWAIANIVAALGAAAVVCWLLGPLGLAYLLLSTYFAVGLHPTGAHILQEHIVFNGGHYETASYYGPINRVSINHGYHTEHHDFPGIAGPRLPALTRIAANHYRGRFFHRSRLATLWQFIFDKQIGLDSRVIHAAPGAGGDL